MGISLEINKSTLYNHIHQAGDRASGGSSIILNNSIPQSQIQLNTNLQAVAVKATLHKTIHVCSLYWGLPIDPTAHWSYDPLVLRPIGPTAHWSYDPLVLRPIGPTTHWSLF